MIREADFAFRQAFAFCPYSPEAVFRYVQLLMGLGRLDEAQLVAETCHKFDPENAQVDGLVKQLESYKGQPHPARALFNQIDQLERYMRTNPNDFGKAFELASKYLQVQRPDRTVQILDGVLNNPHADLGIVLSVINAYSTMENLPKVESSLEKLVKIAPQQPEGWFDLAAVKTRQGKSNEALQDLRRMLDVNAQRLARDPKARDLRALVQTDPQFAPLRAMPEFKALTAPQ
jgi:thioredoxin-like negative regulator of GroEL